MSEVLGLLFAVIVGLTFIPTLSSYTQTANDNTRAATTSQQQKKLIDASSAYVQQYSSNIQSVASATTPAIITVPMLQAVQLLDSSFSATNPFGQTWQTQVLQPSAGNLQALVMSYGGTAMTDKVASKIAGLVGAQGGFIPKNDSGAFAGGAGTAYGAYSGWTMPTANYTSISGGHLASLLTFNNGQLTSNYLYRNSVPGQPNLNRMNTAIDMAGNNINNAGTVSAATVNTSGETYTGGWFRTRGDSGWYSQKWDGGWYMSDPSWIRSYNNKNVYTGGSIQADSQVASGYLNSWGRVRAGEFLQVDGWANEGWGCGPNGLQGRDGTGPLFCQSGVWTRPGGKIAPFRVDGAGTCSWAAATAVCPGGSRLIAGGYVLTWFNGSNFSHAPDGSYPDASGNQWVVNGSGTDSCFQAFATCTY